MADVKLFWKKELKPTARLGLLVAQQLPRIINVISVCLWSNAVFYRLIRAQMTSNIDYYASWFEACSKLVVESASNQLRTR